MGQFLREVGLELKKVHWPTRKQLLVYTGVVLASLAVMAVIIGAFDFVLSQAMDWVIKQ
jgi:preprotein translocase subunit SecE